MRRILPFAPLDLVDLFFNFKRLEIVEFGFMGLEFGMKLVFTSFFLESQVSALQTQQKLPFNEDCFRYVRTVSFLSNSTTLPPLSPVAR